MASKQSVRNLLGVGVALRRQGMCLIGKRKNAHGDGTWAFPGGRVEAGEHPLATAIREVYEETGIDISKNTPIYDPYFSSSSTPSPSSFAIFESLTLSLVDATSHLHMVVRVVVADVNESAQAECKEPDKCESWHWVPWSDIQILSKAQSPSTGSSSSSSGPVTFSPGSPFKSSDKIFAPLRLLSRSPWTPFNARPDAPMLPVDEVEAELREEEERRAAARIAEETKQAMSTSTSTTTASNQGDHPSHNRSSGSSDAVGHPISQDQHASTSSSHVKDST